MTDMKKTTKYVTWAAVLLLLPVSQAAGEQAMSLQECVKLALSNNLGMKSGTLRVDRARTLQGTAFDPAKTSLSLSQDPTSGGSPDNGLAVSQSFEFPTVYAARKKYLKAETAVAVSSLAVTSNDLTRDVSACYYALLHARHTIGILQAQDSVYARFVSLAAAKQKAGEAGNLEVMNARRARSENAIEKEKAEKAYASAKLALRLLLGTDTDVVPAESALATIGGDMPQSSVSFDETPLGCVYAARKAATERSLSLAKQGYMPELSVGFTTQLLIKGFNPYDVERKRFEKGNFMGFEVGVSVPLFWGGTKAKVKAAKKEVEIAEIDRRQAEKRVMKDYDDWLCEYRRARRVLYYYEAQGLAQAEDMARLSQLSYDGGEIGYVEYIQNQKSALDVQLQYASAVNDYNQAVIMLNYLKGNL